MSDCINNDEECTDEEINSEEETEVINDDNGMVINGDNSSSSSLVFEIIKMIFALLLVIGLIYIVLKLLGKRNKLGSNIKSLENVGGISVGQNKSIQLVRIGNQVYMVGVGDNVELLQEITDEDTIQQILNDEQQSEDFLAANFISMLTNKKKKNTAKGDSDQSFEKLFEKELNSLKSNRSKMIHKYKEDSHE
ncbi:flagellar biosynthetic protein FliO [Oceanobacillus sp. 1P07AA]|uniref:flagellar biosynthetic protein FliO n=1 Tax=Oceanobacillus sp. 1P07AA TaxID=3132293 RepID=UPI0039A5A7DB